MLFFLLNLLINKGCLGEHKILSTALKNLIDPKLMNDSVHEFWFAMELKGSYYLHKFNPEGPFYEKWTLLFDLEWYVIVGFSLPLRCQDVKIESMNFCHLTHHTYHHNQQQQSCSGPVKQQRYVYNFKKRSRLSKTNCPVDSVNHRFPVYLFKSVFFFNCFKLNISCFNFWGIDRTVCILIMHLGILDLVDESWPSKVFYFS